MCFNWGFIPFQLKFIRNKCIGMKEHVFIKTCIANQFLNSNIPYKKYLSGKKGNTSISHNCYSKCIFKLVLYYFRLIRWFSSCIFISKDQYLFPHGINNFSGSLPFGNTKWPRYSCTWFTVHCQRTKVTIQVMDFSFNERNDIIRLTLVS